MAYAPQKRSHNKRTPYNKNKKTNTYTSNHSQDTKVFALGGLNEVGKNMYCIEHEDE